MDELSEIMQSKLQAGTRVPSWLPAAGFLLVIRNSLPQNSSSCSIAQPSNDKKAFYI